MKLTATHVDLCAPLAHMSATPGTSHGGPGREEGAYYLLIRVSNSESGALPNRASTTRKPSTNLRQLRARAPPWSSLSTLASWNLLVSEVHQVAKGSRDLGRSAVQHMIDGELHDP